MNKLLAMVILLLVSNAYASTPTCYIFSVGEPVLRGDTIYYPVRRVCYYFDGYRVQESDYTIDEINAENYERSNP